MINDQTVRELFRQLEKQLREADNYLATCPSWAKPRARKQRNAINAACNALHRYTVA